jgi:GT2 family glycosyltransferase
MATIKSLAVLLTCHNRKAQTLDCLNSLYACILPENLSFDVFLVDDGSTDGTGAAIRNQYPEVNIIPGDGSLYWNRGMHLAWETASKAKDYDCYLWLNDDTVLLATALTVFAAGFATLGEKSIYVGATSSATNPTITYSGHRLQETFLKPNGTWQSCDYFNGNIVFIPRAVFELMGMNDPVFQHALGDFDYGLRAKKKKIALYVAPELLGYCETHERLPKWCNTDTIFSNRIVELYKPLGNNPFEFFVFDRRHNGFLIAVKHFISIHLRAFSPSMWRNLK